MKSLGQIAYDAYWKSVRGEPLPQFAEQNPDLIKAWEKAAKAVVDEWSGRGN